MLAELSLALIVSSQAAPMDPNYRDEIASWRKNQETELTQEQGWLSLVGLYWLREGDNLIGSAPSNAVVLPASAPAIYGNLRCTDAKVTLVVPQAPGSPQPRGAVITEPTGFAAQLLQPDSSGAPTKVKIGTTTFIVIRRGARTGVRIWDSSSKARTDFKGRTWYPVRPAYRIVANWTPYSQPKSLSIKNVLGDTSPAANPGYVTFKLSGKTYRLEAQGQGSGLFFNFHDLTSGAATYAAGRFLDADMPKDGKVILDFNKATSPPCAFTAYATCPLPPTANMLNVAVLAGETVAKK
jgi:uncharacterized protein (DUF1684 family)